MFKRILIANRGEIAARIARTCALMGIEYVCVYSDADRDAPYVKSAYTSVALGAPLAAESYLNQSKIIAAAHATKCEAVHPGYGFLSENADFARAVEDAGLIFIGPSPDTIEALGDKARAKVLMSEAKVPTIPGSDSATEDIAQIVAASRQTGFPLLLKPTAGGGGKGMQIVRSEGDLRAAAEEAIRLARANFKNGGLLVEKYIENPRHIEVQVFGDTHGNVVHLFERECSLQRRHQKVLEEAPATSITADTAARLREASVRGAKAVNYVNAGTFEFIVDVNEDFYFLEVNTRLQVEHPVTEEVVSLDLVEWQLRVAAGEPLPRTQADIHADGHAMEVRVYAEDPLNDFRPAPGTVAHVHWPTEVRVETAIKNQQTVSAFYDPMIAKLITKGTDRADALNALAIAVQDSTVHGVTTNLGFLSQILADPNVKKNSIHTRYLDAIVEEFGQEADSTAAIACAAAIALPYWVSDEHPSHSPWVSRNRAALLDRPALDDEAKFGRQTFWLDGERVEAAIADFERDAGARLRCRGKEFNISVDTVQAPYYSGRIGRRHWSAHVQNTHIEVVVAGYRTSLEPYGVENVDQSVDRHSGTAPMPGIVVSIPVNIGDEVAAGTTLVVVEAMKMENHVSAAHAGIVTAVHCGLGDNVPTGQILVEVQPV